MTDNAVLAALALVDIALIVLTLLRARRGGRALGVARWLLMLLLPVAGAAVVLLLTQADGKTPVQGEWMKRNEEQYRSIMALGGQAAQTVPLEEALLLNDLQKRRALMMNMLRSDPRKYMDILLVARFNEDQETAHYATATLLELQHQTQLELQRLQSRIKDAPEDMDARAQYARTLNEYCLSGLLEAQLLRHHRLLLEEALEELLARAPSQEFYGLDVRNSLALGEPSKARDSARRMMALWPHEESAWLEMMRVCVETRDRQGMNTLMNKAKDAKVEWTSAGYEKLKYWMGKAA